MDLKNLPALTFADADAETILGIAVCLLFAAPFLVLGTIWMKKRD